MKIERWQLKISNWRSCELFYAVVGEIAAALLDSKTAPFDLRLLAPDRFRGPEGASELHVNVVGVTACCTMLEEAGGGWNS